MNLTPEQQDNVIRATITAQERAAAAGRTFNMTIDEVAEFMIDVGAIDDRLYLVPLHEQVVNGELPAAPGQPWPHRSNLNAV